MGVEKAKNRGRCGSVEKENCKFCSVGRSAWAVLAGRCVCRRRWAGWLARMGEKDDRRKKIANFGRWGEVRRVLLVVGIVAEEQGWGNRQRRVWGDLPLLYAGWQVYFFVKNPAFE